MPVFNYDCSHGFIPSVLDFTFLQQMLLPKKVHSSSSPDASVRSELLEPVRLDLALNFL